ncbi:MAG: 50S ribosomal protein L30 [Proteobacteria bacterium]|jgi:large subunit ribosomal protein L30|nr:50S ribosomal protein L30 [Pseudomonadota bacterium]
MNKITVHLRRSAIGTTPAQRKNLLGLGLIKTGKYKVLNDTASIRGMIRKVIHLVDVVKGEKIPTAFKPKKAFEVIAGQAPAKKAKAPAKTEAKAAKKPAAKKAAKKA